MGWYLFAWRFRLKSPLHVGSHAISNLSLTRPYVPGKVIWGALTSTVTQFLGTDDYEGIGKFLSNAMRFGYLFFCFAHERNSNTEQIYYPIHSDRGLFFGEVPEHEFKQLVIKAQASTAITPESGSARDGSFHEIEFISPYTTRGNPVFSQGLLWVREHSERGYHLKMSKGNITLQSTTESYDLRDVIARNLQMGGERKYGFGLLQLIKLEKLPGNDLGAFPGTWNERNNNVYIKMDQDHPIWAHVLHGTYLDIKGDIEPLVGRIWGSSGAGSEFESSGFHWKPGSILGTSQDFLISQYGLWRK